MPRTLNFVALQALDRWEERLEGIFEGRPYDILDAALTDTVSKFPVHIQPFRDMIDGMRMDLVKQRYQTFDELYEYCYRVAGTVGLMTTPIMGIDPSYKVCLVLTCILPALCEVRQPSDSAPQLTVASSWSQICHDSRSCLLQLKFSSTLETALRTRQHRVLNSVCSCLDSTLCDTSSSCQDQAVFFWLDHVSQHLSTATYPQGPLKDVYQAALGLGTANQLTNILRDVGEDATERNRIYVPTQELKEFGISESEVSASPHCSAHLFQLEKGACCWQAYLVSTSFAYKLTQLLTACDL